MTNTISNGEAEWLSPGQMSKLFGVPQSTLYDWIKRGLIKSASFREPHKRHGKRLIHVQSVRDYIEAHVVEPSMDVPVVEPPVQFIEPPVQFIEPPVQFIEPPVQFIEQPVQFIEQPVQFIEQPVQFIEQPVQLIEQPVQLIEQPVQLIKQLTKEIPIDVESEPIGVITVINGML